MRLLLSMALYIETMSKFERPSAMKASSIMHFIVRICLARCFPLTCGCNAFTIASPSCPRRMTLPKMRLLKTPDQGPLYAPYDKLFEFT